MQTLSLTTKILKSSLLFLIILNCAGQELTSRIPQPWWILNASTRKCELALAEGQEISPEYWIMHHNCKIKHEEVGITVLSCANNSLYLIFGRTFNDCEAIRAKMEEIEDDRQVEDTDSSSKSKINYRITKRLYGYK